MRTTLEKVRLAAALGAALLVVVVAGFLLYAQHRAHQLLKDLPAHLGINIEKETNGFTLSQSVKGRTVYTIHAAKATQHKDGRTGLRDVGIILYGEKNDRADRISGKDFEYDSKAGIVRAIGEVQLDIQAPPGAGPALVGKGTTSPAPRDPQQIHVTTSGLVYEQQTGVASTDQPIRFEFGGLTGEARGATYNSRTGLTSLEQDVRISGLHDGRPTVLTAAHVDFDRSSHHLALRSARYTVLGSPDIDRSTGETMSAGRLSVHLGPSGSAERAEAEGGVELRSDGSLLEAPIAVLLLGDGGSPRSATMDGGVRFSRGPATGSASEASLKGQSEHGVALFNQVGGLDQLHLTGAVQAVSEDPANAATRSLSGHDLVLRLDGPPRGRRWLSQATVAGDAALRSQAPGKAGVEQVSEDLHADTLVAHWQHQGASSTLSTVSGARHTVLHRSSPAAEETSRGDQLDATFSPAAAAQHPTTLGNASGSLRAATQRGNVEVDRDVRPVATQGQPAPAPVHTRATATQASYDAASGRITLTTSVELFQPGSTLRADQVILSQGSGDAEANGAVQASFRQGPPPSSASGAAQPAAPAAEFVHATADRAVLHHSTAAITFAGGPGGRARLWQAGSQIEAPVLLFSSRDRVLDAYGAAADGPAPVRTVVSNPSSSQSPSRSASLPGRSSVFRISSGRLHYADATGQARLSGGVLLQSTAGTMSSRDAIATFIRPANTPSQTRSPDTVPSIGGALDRVVATTDVVIRQPGRVASGQQAVYTAAEDEFLLTGTPASPPRITDDVSGSITGATLRFRAGDNSVTVDGKAVGFPGSPDGRVHTRARVKQ